MEVKSKLIYFASIYKVVKGAEQESSLEKSGNDLCKTFKKPFLIFIFIFLPQIDSKDFDGPPSFAAMLSYKVEGKKPAVLKLK